MKSLAMSLFCVLALGCAAPLAEPGTDRSGLAGEVALDLDLGETSASGLSSGAFMAVQLGVAYSSTVRGVGAFAGGPYDCAGGSVATALTTCMSSPSGLDVPALVARTRARAASGAIDPVDGIAGQRIFLFGGADDRTVDPAVMDGLRDYYAALVSDPGAIVFERRRPATGHTMPTLTAGVECSATRTPYVGRCGYDGAGEALAAIYGPLAPRVDAPAGRVVAVPQRVHAGGGEHSLAEEALAYVPPSCLAGERCSVHVAFHGCQQSTAQIGETFVREAGYNAWADANHLVILYPQTIPTRGANPNGCWDWWGYDSPDYATRRGPQLRAVMGMLEALAGTALPVEPEPTEPTPTEPAPTEPAPTEPTPTEPAPTEPAPTCVLASNAEHVAAGRAVAWFGFAYAVGTGRPLGLVSPLVQTALRAEAIGWSPTTSCG